MRVKHVVENYLSFLISKTPFVDISDVFVISEALVSFVFKFINSSKHSCKLGQRH